MENNFNCSRCCFWDTEDTHKRRVELKIDNLEEEIHFCLFRNEIRRKGSRCSDFFNLKDEE